MEEPALAAAATPRAAWARALMARYDGAVMRVEPPAAVARPAEPLSDAQQATWRRLQAWCFAGAGDGRSPFWRPGALPRVELRFAVATLADGPEADLPQLVEAFSRHLDGSDQLAAAGGALAGLLLRLRVKRDNALWWRARQASDPWDCGHLIGEPAALRRFQPRRATLMVADGLDGPALTEALQILQSRSAGFAHPVRLLVVRRGMDDPAWLPASIPAGALTEMGWP